MLLSAISTNQNQSTFKSAATKKIAENQYKILATTDIWAKDLKVMMPKNSVEKEALLEILRNRLKLDRLSRLISTKFIIMTKMSRFDKMSEQDPKSQETLKAAKDLSRYGNLTSTLRTLERKIDLEKHKNKEACDYFKELLKIEDQYWDKHIMRPNMLTNYLKEVQKNNLNPNGKYSIPELIEMVENGTSMTKAEAEKVRTQALGRKQYETLIESQYEFYLRKFVSIYESVATKDVDIREARQAFMNTHKEYAKKFPEASKALDKITKPVMDKIKFKIHRLEGISMYAVGTVWDELKRIQADMKVLYPVINDLKLRLETNPDNTQLKLELEKAEEAFAKMKAEWENQLNLAVCLEAENRDRCEEAGKVSEYDFLTSESVTINRFKGYEKMREENGGTMPNDFWTDYLK